MFWLWLALAVSLLFALLSVLDVIFWISKVVRAFHRLREQRLWREQTSTLGLSGLSVPSLTVFALMPYFYAHLWVDPQKVTQDPWVWFLLLLVGVVWVLVVLLWGCTLYLRRRAQPKPRYFYFLPHDATRVRLDQCVYGMCFAIALLPNVVDDFDLLDTMVRSTSVATRSNVFPGGTRDGYRYTNDFKVFCDLAAQGYIQGYKGMITLYQRDPARYEAVTMLLKEFEEASLRGEVKEAVYEVAKEILNGSEPFDIPDENTK